MSFFTKKTKVLAVVTNLEHITGLNTARSLVEAGVAVVGLSSVSDSPLCSTNACRKIYYHTDTNDLVSTLLTIGESLDHQCLLIPCSDQHVLEISARREQLEKYFYVTLPQKDIVDLFMDKNRFADFAKQNSLDIPNSYIFNKSSALAQQVKQVTYPCIIKPGVKTELWDKNNNTAKVIKANNEQELTFHCKNILSYMDECLVQDWIEGPDSNIHFCLLSYDKNTNCLGFWSGRKLRQWPPQTGSTSLAEPSENEFLVAQSQRIFESVGYVGLGSIEYKFCEYRREYFVIEPTVGRPNLQSRIATINGTNLTALLLKSFYPELIIPKKNKKNYKWVNEWAELYFYSSSKRQGNSSFIAWIKSLSGPKGFAIFSISDIKPFIYSLFKKIKLRLKKRT